MGKSVMSGGFDMGKSVARELMGAGNSVLGQEGGQLRAKVRKIFGLVEVRRR